MKPSSTSLIAFQLKVAYTLTVLAIVHVPIMAAVSWALDHEVMLVTGMGALLAALPVLFLSLKRPILWIALSLSVTLVGQTSLLVYALSGHPWQVEMHFYYFAVLAMLSGFVGWRALTLAAVLIALHHLILNWVMPEAVYPGGGNLMRVAVHALVVVVETAMLIGIGHTIRAAFEAADEARNEAQQAVTELEKIGSRREQDLNSTRGRADRLAEMLERFKREIAESTEILHKASHDMELSADGLSGAAARANQQSVTASNASDDTAMKVNSAASAGEELAQTIAEVGNNAAQSSRAAANAVREAENTNNTIDEMASVANEISKVTELINSIAGQTNLLALNATIEAARAGEAGRGFAVVAQEVKALAAQTAKATQEIASRIEAMQSTTHRSVSAIQSISGTIRALDEFSTRIAAAVEQQASAAREIAGNVNAAAMGVGSVSQAINEIETIANDTAAAASRLRNAARSVSGHTDKIRERVTAFAEEVRAVS
jgi:methyl-accepting chemotaxis protein